jgi:small subunit ribosomal protein S6
MVQTQTASSRAREYETIYVLKPDVAKDSAEKVAGRVEEVVQREGGMLTQVETWGRRSLAYPVENHRRGVYVYLKYLGGGALVSELERNLRMLDDVIKYQTVQTATEIDMGGIAVNPENVKFEAIEPPSEDETQWSLERELGLVESQEEHRVRDDAYEDEAIDEDAGPGGSDDGEAN